MLNLLFTHSKVGVSIHFLACFDKQQCINYIGLTLKKYRSSASSTSCSIETSPTNRFNPPPPNIKYLSMPLYLYNI